MVGTVVNWMTLFWITHRSSYGHTGTRTRTLTTELGHVESCATQEVMSTMKKGQIHGAWSQWKYKKLVALFGILCYNKGKSLSLEFVALGTPRTQ